MEYCELQQGSLDEDKKNHWLLAKINHLNPKCIKARGEDKQGIIMIKVIIRIDTDQIVEIGECHLEVELNIDRNIKEGCNMLTIKEMTLEEEVLEGCKK